MFETKSQEENISEQLIYKSNKGQKQKKCIIYIIPIIIAISVIFDYSLTIIFSNGKNDLIQNESNQILVYAIQHNIEIPVVLGLSILVFFLTFIILKSMRNNNFLFYSATFLILFLIVMRTIIGLSWVYRSSTFSFIIKMSTFSALIPAVAMFIYSLEENKDFYCPRCGKEMEYIAMYNDYYCWQCDIYLLDSFVRTQMCPRCGNGMEYINEFNDSYCWLCDNYLQEMDELNIS